MFTLMFGSYTFPNKTFEIVNLPLENNIKEESIPRKHGTIMRDPFLKSRKIKIEGIIHNSTEASSLTELMALQAALLAGEDKFYHRSDRYIDCYLKKFTPDFIKGTDKSIISVKVELLAQVPFFIAAGASVSDVSNATGSTLSFNINNNGNAFSEPIIYICATGGTINDEIQLKNVTKDDIFNFRGILNNGLTLQIDTKDYEVLNNGVDGISDYEGDFLTVVAGSNNFQFVGMTCRITIEHRDRYS